MKQAYNFLLCLAALILGILLESIEPLGITPLYTSFFISSVSTLLSLTSRRKSLQLTAALVLSLTTGHLVFALHTQVLKQEQAKLSGHYGYLVGLVASKELLQHPLYQEHLTVKLEGGKHTKLFTGQRLHGNIGVYIKTPTTANIGDKILFKNVAIKPPSKKITSNDLSLARQGIVATVFAASKYQYKILERESDSLKATIWQWRQVLYNRFITNFSPLSAVYSSLIFFGNKQHALTCNLQDKFALWGLSHYLARSGLHIVLLIAMWFIILRLIPLNIRFKNFFLCLFIGIYTLCSWESISFLRALFVFLLAQGGLWLGREIKTLHLLTLVCMGMILYNPFLIFYLDFQLTFGLTFGLLTFSKHLVREDSRLVE
jgi:competence protein ComEC